MINIWFDGWFSSAYNIISGIRNNPDNKAVKIFGTHYKPMGYEGLCDKWEFRKDFIEDEKYYGDYEESYSRWALEFCERNRIDIFFPRRYFEIISTYADMFEYTENGKCKKTKIMLPNKNLLAILDSKIATKHFIMDNYSEEIVAPTVLFSSIDQVESFKRQLNDMSFPYGFLCMKPNCSTGAEGFRILNYPFDAYRIRDILRKGKEGGYILMPYLDGEEISVDCLNTKKGLIAIPRIKKNNSRVQEIKLDKNILNIVEDINSLLVNKGLDVPYNIQFKKHFDKLYLLEINPRMSGGIYLSNLTGINIPYLAIKQALGEEFDLPKVNEISVCNVERGVII